MEPNNIKIIETLRLIIRDYQEEDVAALAQINANKKAMEFLLRTFDLKATQDFINSQNQLITKNWYVI